MRENISRRVQAILDEGEVLARIKKEITDNKKECDDKKKFLHKEKLENKSIDTIIINHEREVTFLF